MDHEPSPTRDPLPADFLCPACGYDLSGARVERCSECGLEIDRAWLDKTELQRHIYADRLWARDVIVGLLPFGIIWLYIVISIWDRPGEAAIIGATPIAETQIVHGLSEGILVKPARVMARLQARRQPPIR